MMSTWTYP